MINERYVLKFPLGEGRSKVFLCEDIDFPGKDIAIKILPPEASQEEKETFRDEYFILRKLNHPNIIQAIDIGTILSYNNIFTGISPGSKFITLEYFEGKTLLDYDIKDESQLIAVIKEISSILFYLHQSNYIYYDLKPENILVSGNPDNPVIKLIDLGFARNIHNSRFHSVRGTAEYIAPEILNHTSHDHRVDLYSFGMLLYRLIYKKFPFEAAKELDIYKAHIAGNFNFPESEFSENLINVVKRLLTNEPVQRYANTIEVIENLNIPVEDIKKDWIPVKTFTNRKDVMSVINSFIHKQSESEVFAIRGTEGAGKTSVLEEIFERYNNTIFIKSFRYADNKSFWKKLLREIVFSDFIYPLLSEDVLKSVVKLLKDEAESLISSLKSIIRTVAKEKPFILLLDEYNRYDEFSLEIMKEVIPILQIHNIKLIVSEDSAYPYLTESINNLTAVNLTPFTESQLIEYIDKSFASFYPRQEVKKLIMRYADLLPGSIDAFLKDIVLFDILKFSGNTLYLEVDEEKIKLLSGSQEEIYNLQLSFLNDDELHAAKVLSLFDTRLSDDILSGLIGLNITDTANIVTTLREKNILCPANISINPEFTSEGLRKHIYNNIPDKSIFHLTAAEVLEKKYPGFSRVELARQFETAGLFYRSYEKLKEELASAEKLSALSYKRKLLLHIAEFPLLETDINEIKYDLAFTYFRLGDKKSALDIINSLLKNKLKPEWLLEATMLKGNCLISTGELTEGIKILSSILPEVKNKSKQQEILFDIAGAEFDMNNYEIAGKLASGIIENPASSDETRGQAYNLLGLIEFYENGNYENAISFLLKALDVYNSAGLLVKVAGMELNLGNVFDMKGDYDQAELHWNKAMQINQSVGNVEQEAKLLIGYGLHRFNKLEYEKSIEDYRRAINIVSTLGDKNSQGIVQLNLGEVFMKICDYQNSYECLRKALEIFKELKNYEEEAQVLFILGKFFYTIGDHEALKGILAAFKKLLDNNLLVEKNELNYNLLKQIEYFAAAEYNGLPEKLIQISNLLFETDETNNFVFTKFILCDLYMKTGKYEEAYRELTGENFIKECSRNFLSETERKYRLGKLSETFPLSGLQSPVELFEEAYSLIEDQSITELTWRILFALGISYYNRGIVNKANEFLLYAGSVLDFITENIKDRNLRHHYISHEERKMAFEKLAEFGLTSNK